MWADTCSPATVTLMDTATSLVSARAALPHPGRTTRHEPLRCDAGSFERTDERNDFDVPRQQEQVAADQAPRSAKAARAEGTLRD